MHMRITLDGAASPICAHRMARLSCRPNSAKRPSSRALTTAMSCRSTPTSFPCIRPDTFWDRPRSKSIRAGTSVLYLVITRQMKIRPVCPWNPFAATCLSANAPSVYRYSGGRLRSRCPRQLTHGGRKTGIRGAPASCWPMPWAMPSVFCLEQAYYRGALGSASPGGWLCGLWNASVASMRRC